MVADGPGNVLCLDVVRALAKSSDAIDAVLSISENDLGGTAATTLNILRTATAVAIADEGSARMLTEQLALTVAAATPTTRRVGDGFETARQGWRTTYGCLIRLDEGHPLDLPGSIAAPHGRQLSRRRCR
jgi:putative acyl-CoA dehydrogenase